MKCDGLYYQCDIDEYEHECRVRIYADKDYKNYIDSFVIIGEDYYSEETYLNRAYEILYDKANWYKEKIGFEIKTFPSFYEIIER